MNDRVEASYWQRDVGFIDRYRGGTIPGRVDFAIVGAGISGLATALQLRERHPGAEIAVLESQRVGYGASGRNAGFLSPLAAPRWLMGADRDPGQRRGAAWLGRSVHDLASRLAVDVPRSQVEPAGLSIEGTSALTDAGLAEMSRVLEVVGLEHQLGPSRARPGHLFLSMDAYTVHPYQLVLGLAARAAGAGVAIHEGAAVSAIEAAAGGARLQLADGRMLLAQQVVACSNAYIGALGLGERLPALAVRSFMLATPPLEPDTLKRATRDAEFTVVLDRAESYHRVHANRILYGGMDKVRAPRGLDFAVPENLQARLANDMRRSFPRAGAMAVDQAWGGRFHATLSGLPIIRRSRRIPALVFNVGYGGTGLALALALAPLAAALASGARFIRPDDARMLSLIQTTRPPVLDTLRLSARLLSRMAQPWTWR